jgi:hypothetical protein
VKVTPRTPSVSARIPARIEDGPVFDGILIEDATAHVFWAWAAQPPRWEVSTLTVHGPRLKQNGKPGKRTAEHTFGSPLREHNNRPAWVRRIAAACIPEGPFPSLHDELVISLSPTEHAADGEAA